MAHDLSHAGMATKCIHAGQPADPVTGAVTIPISLATTFAQKSPGVFNGYEYSRTGNPTRTALETCLATLEGCKYGLCFASGSATTATIINMLAAGDHVISIDDVYGGTQRYFNRVANPCNNMDFSLVDLTVEGALEAAITEKTKMLWIETPTNPTLKICDIQKMCEIAHKHKLIVVVDNTFASPILQSPIALGADIVMHSITKYINGHSDVVMGFAATNDEEIYTKLKFLQNSIGAIPAPFDAYMVLRGVKTLDIRMQKHCENAMLVAQLLEKSSVVDKVIYPGLKSHPQHDIACKQMKGFGGMITFFLKGGLEESRVFLESLRLFKCAESLGAVECLAEHPAIMTHASVPAEKRKILGISDSLIRLSVGIEDSKDILHDIQSGLDAVSAFMAKSN